MIDLKKIQEENDKMFVVVVIEQLKHISGEVLEALEAISLDCNKDVVAEEVADVILATITLASKLNIDIEEAINKKHLKNKKRYEDRNEKNGK